MTLVVVCVCFGVCACVQPPAQYTLTFRLPEVLRHEKPAICHPGKASQTGTIRVEGFLKKLSSGGFFSRRRWQSGRCVHDTCGDEHGHI